jgi:hypothetical protein
MTSSLLSRQTNSFFKFGHIQPEEENYNISYKKSLKKLKKSLKWRRNSLNLLLQKSVKMKLIKICKSKRS